MKFDTISILSVLQRCGIPIIKAGSYYLCNCPLHPNDSTPSFAVYPYSNSWCCFGRCQGRNGRHNGGGILEFIKQFYHYDYLQAKNWLEQNFTYLEPVIIQEKESEPTKLVPHPWVIYWHSLLGIHREYFHNRKFTDDFIDREMWGWNGSRYCLPVWENEPGNSEILGVRQRKANNDNGPKYIGLKEMNAPTVWGRWYCKGKKTVLSFMGEFDAALANQDGFPSFSGVGGINAIERFPVDWPDLWFPNSEYMIAIFDRKEEPFAGRLCQQWNRVKGSMKARVFNWPLGNFKDYCEYRQENSAKDFLALMLKQGFHL